MKYRKDIKYGIIYTLVLKFILKNKLMLFKIVSSSLISQYIENVYFNNKLSDLFVDINDDKKLKTNIKKLIFGWILLESTYGIHDYMETTLEPSINKFLTDKMFKHILITYDNNHIEINTALVLSKMQILKSRILYFIDKMILKITVKLISLYTIVYNLYQFNKDIGVFVFMVITIEIFIIIADLVRKYRTFDENNMINNDDIINNMYNKISNLEIIMNTNDGYETEIKTHNYLTQVYKDAITKQRQDVVKNQLLGYGLNIISACLIIIYTYKLYVDKKIELKSIIKVLLSINPMLDTLWDITYLLPEMLETLKVIDDNYQFLEDIFRYELKTGEYIKVDSNRIEFKNVSFSYNEVKIFSNINIVIEENDMVALYGSSGSGKSTFARLIMNYYDYTGEILIGNKLNKLIKPEVLKQIITYVPQNTTRLLNVTILENLLYPEIVTTELVNRLKDFMDKYEFWKVYSNINNDNNDRYRFFYNEVGLNGTLLSGGQKQMIHVIRNVFRNIYQIYIFDEPSSALDNQTKENLIKMLKDLNKNRTILIITHDDEIAVICKKKIIFTHNNNPKY